MRALVQRVSEASVTVEGGRVGSIGPGLLVFVGAVDDDTDEDAAFIERKVLSLRIFPDDEGRMNRSLVDIAGQLLVVSQFTLVAAGRRHWQGRAPELRAGDGA
jgi:D-tyrosyl-tRNA(Tyr) deacylase